jgi:hypothetical protein
MLPDKELQAFNKTFRQDVESKSKLAEDCDGSESGCSCKFVALELGVRPERNDSDQKWRSVIRISVSDKLHATFSHSRRILTLAKED